MTTADIMSGDFAIAGANLDSHMNRETCDFSMVKINFVGVYCSVPDLFWAQSATDLNHVRTKDKYSNSVLNTNEMRTFE